MSDTVSSRSTSTPHSSLSLSSPPHSSLSLSSPPPHSSQSLSSTPPKDSLSSLSSSRTSLAKMTPTPIQTAGSKLADKIQESFLVCRLCFESYKLPKCLSCLHTFCESCLENLLQQSELSAAYRKYSTTDYRDVACPICRKRTPIPLGGVRRLPDNFLIEGLSETLVRQRPSKSPQCDICKLLGKTAANASAKCLECQRLMCQDCATLHRQTRVTSGHSLFDIEIEKEIECKDHKEEVVRFYCDTCSLCICIMCTFNEHRSHDISAFQEAATRHHAKIQQMTTVCKNKLNVSERELETIEGCESLMKSVEQFIRTKAEEMRQELNYREKQLVEQLRDLYGKECLKRIANKKDMIIQMEECKSTCKLVDVVLSGKEIEFLLLRKKVEDKLEEINKKPKKKLPKNIEKVVEFRPGTLNFGLLYDYDVENVNKKTKKLKTKSVSFDQLNNDKSATFTTTTTTSDSVVNLSTAAITSDKAAIATAATTSKSCDNLSDATILTTTAATITNAATSTAAATTEQSSLKLAVKNTVAVNHVTAPCGKGLVHLCSVDTQTDPIDWKKLTGKSTKQRKSQSVDAIKKKSDLTTIKEVDNKETSSLADSPSWSPASLLPSISSLSVSRSSLSTASATTSSTSLPLVSVLSLPTTVISSRSSSSASNSVSQIPLFSSTVVSLPSKTSSSPSYRISPIPPFSSPKVSPRSETSSSVTASSSASNSVSPIPTVSSTKISPPSKISSSAINLISAIPPFSLSKLSPFSKISPSLPTTSSSSPSSSSSSSTSSSSSSSSTSASSASSSSSSLTSSTKAASPSFLTKPSPLMTSQQQNMNADVNLQQPKEVHQLRQQQKQQHTILIQPPAQLHQEQAPKQMALPDGSLSSSKKTSEGGDNNDEKAGKKLKIISQSGDEDTNKTTTPSVTMGIELSLSPAAAPTMLSLSSAAAAPTILSSSSAAAASTISSSSPAAASTILSSSSAAAASTIISSSSAAAASTILSSSSAAAASTVLSSSSAAAASTILLSSPLPSSRTKNSSKKGAKSLELTPKVAEPTEKVLPTVATSSKVESSTSGTLQHDSTALKSPSLLPQLSRFPVSPSTLVSSIPISTPKPSPARTPPPYLLKQTTPKILPQKTVGETGTPSIQVMVSPTMTTPVVFKSSQTLPLAETSSPTASMSSLSSPSLFPAATTSACNTITVAGAAVKTTLQSQVSLAPISLVSISPVAQSLEPLSPAPQISTSLSSIPIATAPISQSPISPLSSNLSSTFSLSEAQSLLSSPSLPTKLVDEIHQLVAPAVHAAAPVRITLQSSLTGSVSISQVSPTIKDSEKSFSNIIPSEAIEPNIINLPKTAEIFTNSTLSTSSTLTSSSSLSEAPSSESSSVPAVATTTSTATKAPESSSVPAAATTTSTATKTPATTAVPSSQMALSPFPPQQPIANNSPTTPTTKVIATVAPTISVMASPLSSSVSSTKASSPLSVSSPTSLASSSTIDKTAMPTIAEHQPDSSKADDATTSTTSITTTTEAEAVDQTATTTAADSGENVVYRRRRRKREKEMTHLADSPLFNHRLSLGGSYQASSHHLYSSSFLRHSHVPQTTSSFYSSLSPGSTSSSSSSYSSYTGSHRRSDGSLYSYHKFL